MFVAYKQSFKWEIKTILRQYYIPLKKLKYVLEDRNFSVRLHLKYFENFFYNSNLGIF